MSDLMAGKRVLVAGARNRWSIAWHAAAALHREGASLLFSVLGDREEGGVRKLLDEAAIDAPVVHCDAAVDADIERLFQRAGDHFGGSLDGLIHGIAFANKEELAGQYADTSRDGFALAHDRSVYSLVALCRAAVPLFQSAGAASVVTLSYIGAERAVPNYNVMGVAKAALEASVRYLAADLGPTGVRVNAVSAGPVKTLAAGAIAGFDAMLQQVAATAPLRHAPDADEVADAILFLLSDLARGVTGEVLHVDGGYHIVGMV